MHIFPYTIRSYECGPDGIATVSSILNYLQEAASEHAGRHGFSFPVIDAQTNKAGAWVLAQLRLELTRAPRWGETVLVDTFPHTARPLFAHRDFLLSLEDGTPCGRATSRWALIDPEARRSVRLPPLIAQFDSPRPPVFGAPEAFSRLRYPAAPEQEEQCKYRVMRAHIDLNGHVNNVHYATWMLESVPEEIIRTMRIRELEITFRSETLYGDWVESRCCADTDTAETAAQAGFFHRVSAPEGKDHIIAKTRWETRKDGNF